MRPGSKVKVHYTGTLDDGTVFDSSDGREPLEFTIGQHQVIAGFEDAVKEMELNQEKTVKIKSSDAYGEKKGQLTREISRSKMPAGMNIEVGNQIILKSPAGQEVSAIVSEVTEDKIVIDLNHPLAGKDLTFRIKVVGIN